MSDGSGRDRLLVWPSIAALACELPMIVLAGFEWPFVAGVLFMAAVVGFLFSLFHFLTLRRWRSTVTAAVLPIAILILTRPYAVQASHEVHLWRMRADYDARVAASPLVNGYHFVVWDWSVGFAGGPVTLLVYDESDEIGMPVDKQRFRLGVKDGVADSCSGKAYHLSRHYFVCNF